ncbi:MAG: hypothetical protein AAF734_03335, partial [Bacteroidota bacterium]
ENDALNSAFISSQLTYNITPNWGISGGAVSANGAFNPMVAISYTYFNEKGDFLLNLFPTLHLKDKNEYELSGMLLYTPKLTEKYSLFTQVFFGTSYNEQLNEHLFSFSQFRVGIGFKKYFQVGVGYDQTFIGQGETSMSFDNVGVFLRVEL